jgi:hypothetical protein
MVKCAARRLVAVPLSTTPCNMPCTMSMVLFEQIRSFSTFGSRRSTTRPLREMRSANCGCIMRPLLATAL